MNEDILNRTLKRRHVRQQQKADNNCEPRPSEISNTLRSTVTIFKSIANDLGIDKNSIEEFDRYYDFVHPDFLEWRNTKDGPKRSYQDRKIGPTHAKMLDAFAQDGGRQKLMAWFKFPKMLINKVRKELDRQDDVTALSDKRLGDAMTAVNAAILRCVPLRRYNLAKLRIKSCPQSGEPQTLRIPNETDRDARISIGPAEIKKNGKGIEVLLTPFATAVLRFYRDRIRPEIMRRRGSDPSNPYLFPGAGMQERWHSKHTRDYAKRAWDAGFWLDLHGNRHLTAKIVLDRDPGAMKLVQEVLGHKSEKTTRAYYAEVDELLAHKRFQEYLENAEHENLEELQAILRSVE
jgi:integrase